ncbi:hypothetical protein F4777DRAFT_71032 [Nemania sp. FL0916]|nr:hypothetical protein F4777DRAFT_71032 [Nemania sp. FL0916]
MNRNTGPGGPRRGKHCSYCDRSFARAEHLLRHERSHRNERPYQCILCDASFSRQDTFKRHQSRHHSHAVGDNPAQPSQWNMDTDLSMPLEPAVVRIPSTGAALVAIEDISEPTVTWPPSVFNSEDSTLADSPVLDSSVSLRDIAFAFDPEHYGNLAGAAHECLDINLGANYLPHPYTTPTYPPRIEDSTSWRGSFAISERKHAELVLDISLLTPVRSVISCSSEFKIPTRFSFERLLNTFAECFLIYIPCVHTPTWKTETAPSSLVLAMAAIGATYYDDDVVSTSLYHIARASIKDYLRLTSKTIADEPLWVLQSVLLIMVNGSRSANFQHYQEAASLGSLLIEGIRYRKCPPYIPRLLEEGASLLEQWHTWIEHETTVRTICGVHVVLSALEVTFQTANGLCNLDMTDRYLPCEESEWASPTPKAWLANRQSKRNTPVRFSTVMAGLSSLETPPFPALSTFGSYVILHGIVKQLSSLRQDLWLVASTPMLIQRFEQALDTWRVSSEQNPEFHISQRYPNGVLPAIALSLYRLACIQLYADFRLLRSAFATRDVDTILSRIKDVIITISSSATCIRAARSAIEALQISVKMGLFVTGSVSGWHRKLLFNLYSFESCFFLSFWIRQQSNRSESDRSPEENDMVKLTRETLSEVDLDPIVAAKPCWVQLVYVWAYIFQQCDGSGLHGIVAKVLQRYAESLSE